MGQNQPSIDEHSLEKYGNLIDRATDHDLLVKFDPTARALAKYIKETFETKHDLNGTGQTRGGYTVGVYGEWGSGKTSFLKMVEKHIKDLCLREEIKRKIKKQKKDQQCTQEEIKKEVNDRIKELNNKDKEKERKKLEEKGITPIWFEAWKYDKEDNLWAALLQTILNRVSIQSTWYRRVWVKLRIWWKNLRFREGSWGVLRQLLLFVLRLLIITASIYALFSIYSVITGNPLTTLIQKDQIPSNLSSPWTSFIAILILALAADPFKWADFLKGAINIDFSKFESKPKFLEHIAFVDEFTKEFQRIIELLNPKPLVVIIDDLDRCLPEKAIQVLEAIKVFLDFDKCVFLLALDRKMVERYVAFKYKDMMDIDQRWFSFVYKDVLFYEEYLEKIIQMSIAVPRMAEKEGIVDFIKQLKVESKYIEQCKSIFGTLSPNPRKIKRALMNFLFVNDLIEKEDDQKIDRLILVKLILLHYQYPYLYERLTEKSELFEQLEMHYANVAQSNVPTNITLGDAELEKITGEANKHPGFRKIFEAENNHGNKVSFQGISLEIYFTYIGRVPHLIPPPPPQLVPSPPPLPTSMKEETSLAPTAQQIWNVPPRNTFFIGREQVLKELAKNFANDKIRIQAICGLGGIGKRQIALEYAYGHRSSYNAVLWVNAGDDNILYSSFKQLANQLDLPPYSTQSLDLIKEAVKHWLNNHTQWLLILDSIEDIQMISDLLSTGINGHILLTTRMQDVGNIYKVEVSKLDREEAILFLLRRARKIKPEDALSQVSQEMLTEAQNIIKAMDYLPLALDQAGGYIVENNYSLSEYYEFYQQNSIQLLEQRGTLPISTGHADPVATTLSISYERVKQANPDAAALLRICAFLAPDDIPVELVTDGIPNFDHSKLPDAIGVLQRYSLIQHDPETSIININRLVQVFIKNDIVERSTWAERAVRATYRAFPDQVKQETWDKCRRYLSQAVVCADLIDTYEFIFREAGLLLYRAGAYQFDRLELEDAEKLYNQALSLQVKILKQRVLKQKVLEPELLDQAHSLNSLGLLYFTQSRYKEAEEHYNQSLVIYKERPEENELDVAQLHFNLAGLYEKQGKYNEAEQSYKQSLDIRTKKLGSADPDSGVAASYVGLADLYRIQAKYPLAEQFYVFGLEIFENTTGAESINVATTLNNLAALYEGQNQYDEAASYYTRALDIYKKALGSDHPNVATILNNLALLYQKQSNYDNATSYYTRALDIYKKTLGPDHPNVATILNNLALLYQKQSNYDNAEANYLQALNIYTKTQPEHPNMVDILNRLALLYEEQDKYDKAEASYQQALRVLHITEKSQMQIDPRLAEVLENYAKMLRKVNRVEEAERQEARVKQIQGKSAGKNEP